MKFSTVISQESIQTLKLRACRPHISGTQRVKYNNRIVQVAEAAGTDLSLPDPVRFRFVLGFL